MQAIGAGLGGVARLRPGALPLGAGPKLPALPSPAAPTGVEIGDVGGPPPEVAGGGAPPGASPLGSGPTSRGEGSPFLPPTAPAFTPQPMGGTAPTLGTGPDSRGAGSPFLPSAPPSPGAPSGGMSGGFPMGGGTGTYAQTASYGPGNDLRGTQIAPGDSARTQGANGLATQALGSYASWQPNAWQGVGAPGSYAPGSDTAGLRASLSQALGALSSAPDRGQLAAQNFSLLDQTAQEASARDQRTIGQSAAKFGRIGSGITTTNLGDLGERQAIDRSRAQSQMSLDAAGQTMADRLATAGAMQSGFGALSGADINTAGFNQSLRNESRGERDASNAFNAADFSRRGQLFGDTAAYGQQQTANDAARRDELRGERAYQTGQEQTAYDRNRQGINDANAQQNNALAQALALYGAGNGGDPTAALAGLSASQGQSAASGMGDVASLLAQWARSRSAGAAPTYASPYGG